LLNAKRVAKNRSGRLFRIKTWGNREKNQFTPVAQLMVMEMDTTRFFLSQILIISQHERFQMSSPTINKTIKKHYFAPNAKYRHDDSKQNM
jgi:hypothetical protein